MSVCSQMGNGRSKGGNKKKKGHVKEGTHLDDGSPSGPQELENGDLQQEGSEQFYKDRSRRKDVTKDLLKQIGMTSRDCGKGESTAGCQGNDRNLGDYHASPTKAIPGDVGFTVQDGKDPIGAYGDSSLANGHSTSDESDRNCGDIVADESYQADHVLVDRSLSPGGHPGGSPRDVVAGTSCNIPGSVPVDVPDNAPADAPRDVAVGTSGTVPASAPVDVPNNAPRDVAVGTTGNVPASAPGDVPDNASSNGPGNGPGDVPCDVPGDIPGTGTDNAPIETPGNIPGVAAQSGSVPNPPSYPLQPNSTQRKMPTTGNDISSSNPEQTSSGKAPPREQNEYTSDTTSNQSIPPPRSKTEFSTPSAMQIVPGIHSKPSKDKDAESLKVADQFVSKVVTENTLLLEKLSKYLDRESRVIKCWKHLAYVLDVPPEERGQFDMYTEHSPTEDLFNFLSDIWNPDLTVEELKVKLKNVHRNDVIDSLNREGFKDEMKVCDLISGQPKFIKLLSPKLDIESRTIGNWRSLATEFGIRKQRTEQFGLRGSGPTGALFLHMRTAKGLSDLTMGQLQKHFQEMERKDLVNLLSKQKIEGSLFVKDELFEGSELLSEIGERLNKDIRAIKNWRNLAYRLKIPHEIYSAFDTSKGMAKSPTKLMFEWLSRWKPDLSIGDLLKGIKDIDRFDVVEIITKEAESTLEKVKKNEADSRHQSDVDGATQQSTGKQVFSNLQQMHRDADKNRCGIQELERNARDKGFEVHNNPGKGNCMFYALSEQLELKQGKNIPFTELRKEIVDYLQHHSTLPEGTELFNFTDGYPSWPSYLEKMAQDGTWGDHVVLVAAANVYGTPIRVISSLPHRDEIIIDPKDPPAGTDALVLGHVYEEHYVSLVPMQVHDDVAFSRGNLRVPQRNGQDSQCSQSTRYGEPPFSAAYANQQGDQQLLGCYQSQGYPQIQANQQRQGEQRQQGHYHSQGYQQRQVFQQRHDQQPPLSKDHRVGMKVRELPLKEVYSKICVKLNIKRMFFDDFRMVAEELGMDRDTTEYVGQQKDPTDFIFSEYRRNVTVGELVKILHKIERLDVAAVLEKWIDQGSA